MKNKILFLTFFSLTCWATTYAQKNNVTGKVLDRFNQPIQGALIYTSGDAAEKVTSDIQGAFTISANSDAVLVIEASHQVKKEVPVNGSSEMIIHISYAEETVSTGFGIKQTRGESTSALWKTQAKDIDTRSAQDVSNALYGNVLGLTTLEKGGTVWEDGASFSIRGLKTLSQSGTLVLVDGFERPLDELTVAEVASVTTLRDAAAVALYGYRGANGVLLVETKKGMYNSNKITFSYDHGFTSPIRLPKFANGYMYANALNEALVNDGSLPRYSQNELDAFQSGKYPTLYPSVDWVNETLRDHGASNIYNINFQGGGKNMRYFTLLDLQSNYGFMRNTELNEGYSTQLQYSKANIRTNLDIDIFPTTKAEIHLLGILNEHNRPGTNQSTIMQQLYQTPSAAFPIKTDDGIWGGNSTLEAMNPVANATATGYSRGHSRSMYADMKLTQDLKIITKGLSASVRFGYDNSASYWENRTRGFEYAQDQVNMTSGVPTDTTRITGGQNSAASFSTSLGNQVRHANLVADIDYNTTFGESSLYTTLIYSQERVVNLGQNNTYNRQNISSYSHYGYKKKYFADLALVYSGSNALAPGSKFHFSPTLSAAWLISNENFMKNVKAIEMLKLRGSAGIINTDNVPAWNIWKQSYVDGNGYALGQNYDWYGGMQQGQLPTPNFTNEKAYKLNLGLDAAFFHGFILSADIFSELRKDILVESGGQISTTLGIQSPYLNAGEVKSYGTELGISYDHQFGNVIVNAGVKYTLNKNKIINEMEAPQPYSYLEHTGKPLGQLFGLQAIGYFIDQNDISHSPAQQFSDVKPGDIKYKDQNGDGIINDLDNVALGYNTTIPEIYYSFNFGAEWKGIGFDALFQGVSNYTVITNTISLYTPLVGNATISEEYYNNRWTPNTPFAKYPRLTTVYNANNFRNNSIWMEDGSFLKLRNFEIYYKIPKIILTKVHLNSAKVYLRGVDLLCFDKVKIADPESIGTSYPTSKSVNIGIILGF